MLASVAEIALYTADINCTTATDPGHGLSEEGFSKNDWTCTIQVAEPGPPSTGPQVDTAAGHAIAAAFDGGNVTQLRFERTPDSDGKLRHVRATARLDDPSK